MLKLKRTRSAGLHRAPNAAVRNNRSLTAKLLLGCTGQIPATTNAALTTVSAGLPIRCNAVQPGMTDTPMVAGMPGAMRARWETQIPAGRFGEAAEVAQAIAFLASDAASYINGTGLLVDGGLISRAVVR